MQLKKNMNNLEIAELLRSISAAYEVRDKNKNRFKVIAYDRAAAAVEHLSSEAKDLWDDGKLEEIPGIGPSMAKHLDEIFRTGRSKHFEKITGKLPPSMFEFMKIPGIGPKTAIKLSDKLKIKNARGALEKLRKAIKECKVEEIEGMGEKTQESIEKSIKEIREVKKRMLLPYASRLSDELIAWLKDSPKIQRVDPLGSLRRQASSIGDIDISVASKEPEEAIKRFTNYPKSKRVLDKGEKSASILLPGNIRVDLKVQKPGSYGSLLQHFTGSKHHNIALREYAMKKGLSLSEYGIKKRGINGKVKKFRDEKSFYNYLGMEWIPPELREDAGEIEAAIEGKIPKLVKIDDIKSDLQMHSDFDIETSHDLGESSMEEIVLKANGLKYEYIALTEHNPSQRRHNEKQVIDLLKRKKKKIEQVNSSLVKIVKNNNHKNDIWIKKVFNSLEVDILPSGELAISDKALNVLDFALVSIHSSFRKGKVENTKRILSALDHPKVKIFAHPTARLINKREGIEADWIKIFEFCVKNNKFIEINASPGRLDLPDFLVREALKYNVKFSMGTDAHHVDSMDNMKWGISVARRGWARKENVINTLNLADFERIIK